MESNSYHVQADWEPEANVWVATSDDVPGLTVECNTREEIVATAPEIALELLEIEAGHTLPQPPGVTFVFD